MALFAPTLRRLDAPQLVLSGAGFEDGRAVSDDPANIPPHDDATDAGRGSQATRLLRRLNDGDEQASVDLLEVLYHELHSVAAQMMQRERAAHTMQPTALVHEAYLRLIDTDAQQWQDKVHFLRVAARAMRRALIDHARAKMTDKRGGGHWQKVTLVDDVADEGHGPESLIAVDETLSKLEAFDPQLAQIVELRFFGGLKNREIAMAIETSERSVQRGWRTARAWLLHELKKDGDES